MTGPSKSRRTLRQDTPLTRKERAFIRYFMQTNRVEDSTLRAGYSHAQYGAQLLRDPKIQKCLQVEMERQGISDEYLAKKLKDGLGAKYAAQYYKDGALKQKDAADYHTRKEYLDMALKVRGDYAPERMEIQQSRIEVIIDLRAAQGLLDSGAITPVEFEELKQAEEIDGRAKVETALPEHAGDDVREAEEVSPGQGEDASDGSV
jgi:phage terminase small subunit